MTLQGWTPRNACKEKEDLRCIEVDKMDIQVVVNHLGHRISRSFELCLELNLSPKQGHNYGLVKSKLSHNWAIIGHQVDALLYYRSLDPR